MLAAAILVLVAVHVGHIQCLVEPIEHFPQGLQDNFNIYHGIGDLTKQSGELVFWNCIQEYISKFVQSRSDMTPSEVNFFTSNIHAIIDPVYGTVNASSRVKRQARQRPRLRKEIRTLTRRELRNYFAAVNALKRDTRLRPNLYDVLSDFHTGDNLARAHFGPAFPAWHRLYLWVYESFLRQHVGRVTVPYWASPLDNGMADATRSVIWSNQFFGGGIGVPTDGPFADWNTLNPSRAFERSVGSGPLMTFEGIERIISRTRNRDILIPTAGADSNLEAQHGAPHMFVGGSMSRLNQAVRDPVFYSHHSFIDMIWEQFRFNQRRSGISPESDYPWVVNDPRFRPQHIPTGMMGFFPGPRVNYDFQNRVGYSNVWFNLVRYDPIPECPRCGRSRYLRCSRTTNRCVSRRRSEMAATPGRRRRAVTNSRETCSKKPFLFDINMNYLDLTPVPPIQAAANVNDWVHIPVKIISKRPPTYKGFQSFSLYNNAAQSFAHLGLKNSFSKLGNQLAYQNCDKKEDAVGKIKIVSYGLNYNGYSEEHVFVDNRLGVSDSTGFVSVKAPGTSTSEALIAAFDSCGRVCKPYCRTSSSGETSMPPFAGGVRVSNQQPLQYGRTYAEATMNAWSVMLENSCPTPNLSGVPISFYCEFTDNWIWNPPSQTPVMAGAGGRSEYARVGARTSSGKTGGVWPGRGVTGRMGGAGRRGGTGGTSGASRGGGGKGGGRRPRRRECVVNSTCIIDTACVGCDKWQIARCRGGRKMAICFQGRFSLTTNTSG